MLTNKLILVGVTGGIAAYKSADLIRRLREAGADVRVAMTEGASRFITALTLQALSGHPVHQKLLDPEAESGMGHIEIARWADAILVAPASANFLARLSHGMADDLLTAVCLATEAELAVAPAMNQQMWQNPNTQENLERLQRTGVSIFGPDSGSQACGEVGPGRMLEPTELTQLTANLFASGALQGLNVVITAGPTWEAIDPVRGITNHSSGKMGYALAQAAIDAGARVTLVSGPTSLAAPPRATLVQVTSALDMQDAVSSAISGADIFVGVAAVADYRPLAPASQKIKKDSERISLELVKNPDIVAAVAARPNRPFTVGFAAETEDLLRNAQSKLRHKGLDLIIANRVSEPGLGFGSENNAVTVIDLHGSTNIGPLPKTKLARSLIQETADRFHASRPAKNTRSAYRN